MRRKSLFKNNLSPNNHCTRNTATATQPAPILPTTPRPNGGKPPRDPILLSKTTPTTRPTATPCRTNPPPAPQAQPDHQPRPKATPPPQAANPATNVPTRPPQATPRQTHLSAPAKTPPPSRLAHRPPPAHTRTATALTPNHNKGPITPSTTPPRPRAPPPAKPTSRLRQNLPRLTGLAHHISSGPPENRDTLTPIHNKEPITPSATPPRPRTPPPAKPTSPLRQNRPGPTGLAHRPPPAHPRTATALTPNRNEGPITPAATSPRPRAPPPANPNSPLRKNRPRPTGLAHRIASSPPKNRNTLTPNRNEGPIPPSATPPRPSAPPPAKPTSPLRQKGPVAPHFSTSPSTPPAASEPATGPHQTRPAKQRPAEASSPASLSTPFDPIPSSPYKNRNRPHPKPQRGTNPPIRHTAPPPHATSRQTHVCALAKRGQSPPTSARLPQPRPLHPTPPPGLTRPALPNNAPQRHPLPRHSARLSTRSPRHSPPTAFTPRPPSASETMDTPKPRPAPL
jgi:hypothetical protein